MHRKRLTHWIDLLEDVRARDIALYMHGADAQIARNVEFPDFVTGTLEPHGVVLSAFGHAALDQWFSKQGLYLRHDDQECYQTLEDLQETLARRPGTMFQTSLDEMHGNFVLRTLTGIDAIEVFFEILPDDAAYLRSPKQYPAGRITPEMVMRRIRGLLSGSDERFLNS